MGIRKRDSKLFVSYKYTTQNQYFPNLFAKKNSLGKMQNFLAIVSYKMMSFETVP